MWLMHETKSLGEDFLASLHMENVRGFGNLARELLACGELRREYYAENISVSQLRATPLRISPTRLTPTPLTILRFCSPSFCPRLERRPDRGERREYHLTSVIVIVFRGELWARSQTLILSRDEIRDRFRATKMGCSVI